MIFIAANISPTRCLLAYVVWSIHSLWQFGWLAYIVAICMYQSRSHRYANCLYFLSNVLSLQTMYSTCIFVLAPHTVHSIP